MSGDDGAERAHEATPKRREQARREGRLLTSKEVSVLATAAAGTAALQALATFAPLAVGPWSDFLRHPSAPDRFETTARLALAEAGVAVLAVSAAVALPVAAAAILAQAVLSGLHWTPANIAFRGNRIDPLAGFGRMFSARSPGELAKALAKVALLGAVAVLVARHAVGRLPGLQDMPHRAAVAAMADLALSLFWSLTLALAAIGAADLAWQARQLSASLRMTFDELRREAREDSGAPELKARQRRLQHEAARRGARERAALAVVPAATAIITNPRHFAVAIRYAAGEMAAPVIVARGTDRMAAQIVQAGRRAGVPLLPIPPLARALYFTGDIGRPIAEGLFTAVAAVLAHLWRLERGHADELPQVELPPDLRFTPHGRRIS